ncbi:MAG: WG repeat-containing protein [Rikenellaceae bacterium]|nr:WG repeat-containing protein [Rikenellaceae bacterium]
MTLTLTNLTESILNPYGRFRTLGNLSAVCDAGEPVFSAMTHSYNFLVETGGRRYLLKYFFRPGSRAETTARLLAGSLPGLDSAYLAGIRYLDREILVFDDRGAPMLCDILIQEIPESTALGEFARKHCAAGDTASLRTLSAELCRMGAWLLSADLVHGNLRPSNILVTPALKPLLINFDHMATPQTDEHFDRVANADNTALATLALTCHILSQAPALYTALGGHLAFQPRHLRQLLSRLVLSPDGVPGAIHDLIRMLEECRDTISDRKRLADLLLELAGNETRMTIGFRDTSAELPERLPTGPERPEIRVQADLSAYDWHGTSSETLTCVARDGRFGYVDGQANEAIPLIYDWACDFREGRAVVVRDDLYGMIDRSGREIVAPAYELLDWDADNGIAKVMSEGLFGLLNRLGEEIVPLIYEWMGEMDSGLIPARKDDRYGYLRRDGSVAIPFVFDDAYDFADGRALVLRGESAYYIDPEGNALPSA